MKYSIIKKIIDFFTAMILLLMLSPLFSIIALLIFFQDFNSVFFLQDRIGLKGKKFRIVKFRTMRINTPNVSTFEMGNDASLFITGIGRLLRKSSLDELPQLVNVLRGEMSFIGPRPALLSQSFLLNERKKYKIDELLPGITGLAQINGRDDLSDMEKTAFDAEYYSKISFLFDIQIALRTVLIVMSGKGNK